MNLDKYLFNDFRKVLWECSLVETKGFVHSVRLQGIEIQRVILFGSFPSRKEKPNDVDMLILFDRENVEKSYQIFNQRCTQIHFLPEKFSKKLIKKFFDEQKLRYGTSPIDITKIVK